MLHRTLTIFLAVFPNKYEDSLEKRGKTLEFSFLSIPTRPDDSPDDSPLDAGWFVPIQLRQIHAGFGSLNYLLCHENATEKGDFDLLKLVTYYLAGHRRSLRHQPLVSVVRISFHYACSHTRVPMRLIVAANH